MSKLRTWSVGIAMLALLASLAGAAETPAWELVGTFGALRFVYVEPAGLKDPALLARIIGDIFAKSGKERPIEVDFFDARAAVPQAIPFTPEQRRHQRAKFNFNPKTGMQRFVRIDLVPDPNNAAKLLIKETEEKLPLP